jgi:peptidoglycan/xylan/chitin deacetylase (PgdA/CDA1 family)
MKEFYPYLPIPFRLEDLRRRADVTPLIINYHMVSDEELPYIKNLYHYRDVSGFRKDLELFRSVYQPVGMIDLLESLFPGGKPLPGNALILTFDDGFREMHDIVVPLLLEFDIPATFFLTCNFIDNKSLNHDNKKSMLVESLKLGSSRDRSRKIDELIKENDVPGKDPPDCIMSIPYAQRSLLDDIAEVMGIDFNQFLNEIQPYLTSTQVENLIHSGFTIGAHSVDHANFGELSQEGQIDQIRKSLAFLARRFSIDYSFYAFPYSDRGVSSECFRAVSGEVDLTFGTHGLKRDRIRNHFQRINVEKYRQAAINTIKYHYSRLIILKKVKREYIKR